jgi:hypothetical protein
MSFEGLQELLHSMFSQMNAANGVSQPTEIWNAYQEEILALAESPDPNIRKIFTAFGDDIVLPQPIEAARILQNLRQRFSIDEEGRRLVGRIRTETVLRTRPKRDVPRESLIGNAEKIAGLTPANFTTFSQFHINGWDRVLHTIRDRDGLVIVAPTGSGKTEVFLLPLIYAIVRAITREEKNIPRFVLLYPRVALLKDQLARIFQYVHNAEQAFISLQPTLSTLFGSNPLKDQKISDKGIIIGFQFGGIYASTDDTKANRDLFTDDLTFRVVDACPVCNQGKLKAYRTEKGVTRMRCGACMAEFRTSISKKDHARTFPHLMVTTAESLDRIYLNPEFEGYLKKLSGVVLDEAHLYHSLYGAHIHHLIREIEELQGGSLAKIAISATISSPERFVSKLFYGKEDHPLTILSPQDEEGVPNGLEVLYFLQSPEEGRRPGAAPTLIQTVLATGHALQRVQDRTLVFTDSLDMAGRLEAQIRNAETERWNDINRGHRGLWEFRTIRNVLSFHDHDCPRTNPANCPNIYGQGECWRGVLGGKACCQSIDGLREQALNIIQVSSHQQNRYWQGDIVVTTPTLEVGVDDEHIKSTIHYLPPRTVFSFTQRRGRAGRKGGEVTSTIMVLGNTPSDNFYFFRRNRLLYGSYELPLNPSNPVLQHMHDRLRHERQRMKEYIEREHSLQRGIWAWIWGTLKQCQLISNHYREKLSTFQACSISDLKKYFNEQKKYLRTWVSEEKSALNSYLSLRWILREIEDEAPDQLQSLALEATQAVDQLLTNQGVSVEEVGKKLKALDDELSDLINKLIYEDGGDQVTAKYLMVLQGKVKNTWNALKQQKQGIETENAERLFDFFRALEEIYADGKPWILNSVPDVIKIVLQALFYLHLGIGDDEDFNCQSRVDFFIPQTYFQEVKPIVLEIHYQGDKEPELHEEDISSTASLLVPYKPLYRYHPHPYLSMIETEHNPAWVSDDRQIVRIRLRGEGQYRGDTFTPQKIYAKALKGDEQGQQIVKMCMGCYAVYSISRQRPCHDSLRTVKLYAEPLIQREYHAKRTRPITQRFQFTEKVEGTTTVGGADVRAHAAIMNGDQYIISRSPLRAFQALYESPIRYSLTTNGIVWNLAGIVDALITDTTLQEQLEQILIDGRPKSLNEELVLHTAAHMLQKAVASISGVGEQVLEYSFNLQKQEVIVWERYEGGVGISEVFENALRERPLEVYRELLASILCLVDLAERDNWTSFEQLQTELANKWRLLANDEVITNIVREASSERQIQSQRQNEESRLVCHPPQGHDGCPACIQTTSCTGRNEQSLRVSRLVGEIIMTHFIRSVSRDELQSLVDESTHHNLVLPTVLQETSSGEMFDILLL